MAFYFSKRKIRPKEEDDLGELNIIPYLDILMNLIIFMLLSMTGLASFGILNVNAPAYSEGGGGGANNDKPELLLTVAISKKGFYIAATGAVLEGQVEQGAAPGSGAPTIPLGADGLYNYGALNEAMKKVKASVSEETKVIIAAEADTEYEVLVGTMDATRETNEPGGGHKLLFPDVTLGSF